MVIAFPTRIRQRLEEIEALEGMPQLDLVHQAVEVWCHLTADERRILGLAAISLVVERHRKGGAA